MTGQTQASGQARVAPLDVAVFSRGRQSKQSVQYFRTSGGTRVRIRIVCDSVGFQSSATACVLDPGTGRWNAVAEIHFSQMQTVRQKVNPYDVFRNADHEAFEQDQRTLLNQVALLLD